MANEDPVIMENLKEGETYLYNSWTEENPQWVKAKIHFHWRGQPMVEIMEGLLKGKQWYLFSDSKLKRLCN